MSSPLDRDLTLLGEVLAPLWYESLSDGALTVGACEDCGRTFGPYLSERVAHNALAEHSTRAHGGCLVPRVEWDRERLAGGAGGPGVRQPSAVGASWSTPYRCATPGCYDSVRAQYVNPHCGKHTEIDTPMPTPDRPRTISEITAGINPHTVILESPGGGGIRKAAPQFKQTAEDKAWVRAQDGIRTRRRTGDQSKAQRAERAAQAAVRRAAREVRDKAILEALAGTETLGQIVERLGLSKSTIYNVKNANGIERRFPRLTGRPKGAPDEVVLEALRAGESVKSIVLRLHVHSSRVRAIRDAHGIPAQGAGGRPRRVATEGEAAA